ncbi:MAG: hypothetical protein ACRC1W_03740 [Shewanella sp.]
MAEAIDLFAANGTTLISTIDFGRILPGDNYFNTNGNFQKFNIKNTGDVALTNITIEFLQAANSPTFQWGWMYPEDPGNIGSPLFSARATKDPVAPPGTPPALALGTLAVGAAVLMYVNWEIPLGASGIPNATMQLQGS